VQVYRVNDRVSLPAPDDQAVARRSTVWGAPPLLVLAVAFFLPAATDCGKVVSPLDESASSLLSALWIAPTYVAAAVLVVATLVFRLVGYPTLALARVAVIGLVASLAVMTVVFLWPPKPVAMAWIATTVLSAALPVRSRRRRGWRELAALHDVYAVAALPVAVVNLLFARYVGAYAFVIAYVTFAVHRLVWIWPLRTKRQSL
jgi:hypothetical protein